MPWYARIVSWLPGSESLKFTILYVALISVVNVFALVAAGVSHRAFRERLVENYSRFALSLLPLTCAGFLAFHTYYLLTLGPKMLALVGQFFGVAILRGTETAVPGGIIRLVQTGLMAVGLVWTWMIQYSLRRSSPRGRFGRRWGVVPHMAVAAGLATGLVLSMAWAFPV